MIDNGLKKRNLAPLLALLPELKQYGPELGFELRDLIKRKHDQ